MRLTLCLLTLGLVVPFARAQSIPNASIEQPGGWELLKVAGAEGSMSIDTAACSGAHSLKLTKTNAPGYLVLRSSAVSLQPNVRYRCRFRFHAEDASLANLLLLRVAPKDALLAYNAIDRSAGWMSQSLLINSPPGQWEKRVVHYEVDQPQEVFIHALLWGNPCSVSLDDFEITGEPYKITGARSDFQNSVTPEQLPAILQARPNATGQITVRNGRSTFLLNGQPTAPIIYKSEPYTTEGDFRRFGEAGVKLATVSVRIGDNKGQPGIWTGKDQYNFAPAEAALQKALLRNPQVYVVLDLDFYPYAAWGEENPQECWTNEQGQRAYGTWGNVDGFEEDLSKLKPGRFDTWHYPSYQSSKWREGAGAAARKLIEHLNQTPYGKAIVGYYITGGHDGQFQTLGQYDYSAATQDAFRQWLQRKYGTIEKLKAAWGEAPATFADVRVPAPLQPSGNLEAAAPYVTTSPSLDYRAFAVEESWKLRDVFAGIVKQAAGKPVITISYGNPSGYDFWPLMGLTSLDAAASMSYYPYRNNGYALGFRPYDSFPLHGKLFLQELDTRSWAGSVHSDEVYQMWIGAGLTPPEWQAINRKLAGVSLAHGTGFWYYDMNHFFDAPEIMGEIAQTAQVGERLRQRPAPRFRPDVCVVETSGSEKYFSSEFASARNSIFYQLMALEESGVPYDRHYLPDVLRRPELQSYRVYVFVQAPFLTAAERAGIKARLQRGDHTLIWVHDTGYLSEGGKSAEGMSALLGMTVKTEEKYARVTPIVDAASPVAREVQPVLGLNEMAMMIMTPTGQSSFATREQPFWIDDPQATPFAHYAETGQAAAARKTLPGWTSVYLAGSHSLTGDLLNVLARQGKAFTAGPAGQSINMSGQFVSLHGLRTGPYMLRLPPGTKRVVDIDTGKELPIRAGVVTLDVVAQRTYWLELF